MATTLVPNNNPDASEGLWWSNPSMLEATLVPTSISHATNPSSAVWIPAEGPNNIMVTAQFTSWGTGFDIRGCDKVCSSTFDEKLRLHLDSILHSAQLILNNYYFLK